MSNVSLLQAMRSYETQASRDCECRTHTEHGKHRKCYQAPGCQTTLILDVRNVFQSDHNSTKMQLYEEFSIKTSRQWMTLCQFCKKIFQLEHTHLICFADLILL